MEDLIGKFLNAAIPWIIPVIILCSFLSNHGYNSHGRNKENGSSKSKPSGKTENKKDDVPPIQDDSMK